MKTKTTITLPEPKLPPAVTLTRRDNEVVVINALDSYALIGLAIGRQEEKPEETVYFVLLKHRNRQHKEKKFRLFIGKSDLLQEAEAKDSWKTPSHIGVDYSLYGKEGNFKIPVGKKLLKRHRGYNEHKTYTGELDVVDMTDAKVEAE